MIESFLSNDINNKPLRGALDLRLANNSVFRDDNGFDIGNSVQR